MATQENESPEVKAVFDQLRLTRGRVPAMYRTLAQHPGVLNAHRAYFHAALEAGVLERGLKEQIVYKVSQLRGNTYSMASHRPLALRHGITEERLSAIERSDYVKLPPAEAVALQFAEAMTVLRGKVSEETLDELKRHFSSTEIIEICAVAGLTDYASTLQSIFGLEAE
jgi:AhpD family alkylhydroperoxidase